MEKSIWFKEITIKNKHLKNADRNDDDNCPIAKCLKEAYPDKYIAVYENSIEIQGKHFALSQELFEAIRDYDNGLSFPLGTYKIYENQH